MTPDSSSNDRRIDYIEFAVRDLKAARTFYSLVFGWSFTNYGDDYLSFADGRLTGGFRKSATTLPTNPLVVIYSRDLEKTEADIKNAGGIIVVGTHSFPGGRRFSFQDKNGLELAAWSDCLASGAPIS